MQAQDCLESARSPHSTKPRRRPNARHRTTSGSLETLRSKHRGIGHAGARIPAMLHPVLLPLVLLGQLPSLHQDGHTSPQWASFPAYKSPAAAIAVTHMVTVLRGISRGRLSSELSPRVRGMALGIPLTAEMSLARFEGDQFHPWPTATAQGGRVGSVHCL